MHAAEMVLAELDGVSDEMESWVVLRRWCIFVN